MPAAAVIPAEQRMVNIVAVKKFVVIVVKLIFYIYIKLIQNINPRSK